MEQCVVLPLWTALPRNLLFAHENPKFIVFCSFLENYLSDFDQI